MVAACRGAVAVRACGQLVASSFHPDGRGRCSITSLTSCLCRGSWIYLSFGLSDSLPWCVEVCDREMERGASWTGRVRADCLSVMNINGLLVSLCSSGLPFWKQAWEANVGWLGSPSSLAHTVLVSVTVWSCFTVHECPVNQARYTVLSCNRAEW